MLTVSHRPNPIARPVDFKLHHYRTFGPLASPYQRRYDSPLSRTDHFVQPISPGGER
jgi:hypothetical protein